MAETLNASMAQIKKYMNYSAQMVDVKPASHWSDAVLESITNPDSQLHGLPIHYLNYVDLLRFRAQEVSVWAGVNGHGKSMALSQFVLAGLFSEKFGIISPEMTPVRQMQRMTYQATRSRHGNPDQIRAFHKFTDGRLWLYDQQGNVNRQELQACMRYMGYELGITHIVIDSMMKCVQSEDDMNDQKSFVNMLCQTAKELNIHIHLVCHSRKRQKETDKPDKFDIKGTGAITDLVDNVLLVWRNKAKENALKNPNLSVDDRRKAENDCDSRIICVKQRHYDWEGDIALNYHAPSMCLMNGLQAPMSVDWIATNNE